MTGKSGDIEQRIKYKHALISSGCFLTAVFFALSAGLTAALIKEGNFTKFELSRLLMFVPAHEALWRAVCASHAVAAVGLLFVVVGWTHAIGQRLRPITTFALLLMSLGVYATLDSLTVMFVQLSDAAREISYSYSLHHSATLHLTSSWTAVFLSRLLIIGNSLESVAGIILALCSFQTRTVPSAVSWLALLVWLTGLNASIAAYMGQTDTALMIYCSTRVLLVAWTGTYGIYTTLRYSKRPSQRESAGTS